MFVLHVQITSIFKKRIRFTKLHACHLFTSQIEPCLQLGLIIIVAGLITSVGSMISW